MWTCVGILIFQTHQSICGREGRTLEEICHLWCEKQCGDVYVSADSREICSFVFPLVVTEPFAPSSKTLLIQKLGYVQNPSALYLYAKEETRLSENLH